MLYVGFMKRSMGSLTPTTSTIMNSAAKNIILTEIVNVKLLVLGGRFCNVRAGSQHPANS
jgi:tartrate dehydratase beta subunit/fumarate hydratase class I family protein